MKAQYFLYVLLFTSISCIGINADFGRTLGIALENSVDRWCMFTPEMISTSRKANECIQKKTTSDVKSVVESYCRGEITDCINTYKKSAYKCVNDETKDSVKQFEKTILGGMKALCEMGDDDLKNYLENPNKCDLNRDDFEECEAIVAEVSLTNSNDIFTEENCEKYIPYKECVIKAVNEKCPDMAQGTETILNGAWEASPCTTAK